MVATALRRAVPLLIFVGGRLCAPIEEPFAVIGMGEGAVEPIVARGEGRHSQQQLIEGFAGCGCIPQLSVSRGRDSVDIREFGICSGGLPSEANRLVVALGEQCCPSLDRGPDD